MATPYPNYVGQVEVTTQPIGEHEWILIPCWKLQFHDGLQFDALYSAASSPGCDIFPGQSDPGVLDFWGPWRSDFNPYATTAPTLLKGQTVQAKASIYAGILDCLMPQATIANIEWFTDMTAPHGPFWHIVLVAGWVYNGFTQTGVSPSDWTRGAGVDNDCGDSGFH